MALGARTSTNPLPPSPPPPTIMHAERTPMHLGMHCTQCMHCFLPPLQRTNAENSLQIFPEKELRGHSPNFHIHVSVSDLYIPRIDLPILLQENMWTDPGNILIAHRYMNVENWD